jgi:hypothetical protein
MKDVCNVLHQSLESFLGSQVADDHKLNSFFQLGTKSFLDFFDL